MTTPTGRQYTSTSPPVLTATRDDPRQAARRAWLRSPQVRAARARYLQRPRESPTEVATGQLLLTTIHEKLKHRPLTIDIPTTKTG